jgi:transcription initiation factor TFIIIB Brf1 subunit/transcription initiation factor TFIIB
LDSDTACPKGGKHKLVDDIPGEKSCTKCGITIIVHEGTGDNPVIDDHGLGSNIDKDNTGFRKIARHHKFVPGMSFAKEVALADRQIEIASDYLLPGRVKNRALALFKKTRKPLKGKNFETFVGACVFIACREQGIPIHVLVEAKNLNRTDTPCPKGGKHELVRTCSECGGNIPYPLVGICPERVALHPENKEHLLGEEWCTKCVSGYYTRENLFSWKDVRLVKYYKEICNHLEINLPPDKAINNVEWIGKRVEYDIEITITRSERYPDVTHVHHSSPSAGVGTKLSGSVIREATKLLSKIPDSETGSNQIGIAAAILWIVSVASDLPFTQKQFAKAAGVNLQTVSNSAKRLNRIIKKNKLGKHVAHNAKYYQKRRAGKYLKGKDVEGKDVKGRKQKNSRSAKWLEARRRKLLDGTS